MQSCNFLNLLAYVGAHYWPNFKAKTVFNLKLWVFKVGKLDVRVRPLFANPVTYNSNKHVYTAKVADIMILSQQQKVCIYTTVCICMPCIAFDSNTCTAHPHYAFACKQSPGYFNKELTCYILLCFYFNLQNILFCIHSWRCHF